MYEVGPEILHFFNCNKIYITFTILNPSRCIFKGLQVTLTQGALGPHSVVRLQQSLSLYWSRGRWWACQSEQATRRAFQELPGRGTREGATSLQRSEQKLAWLGSVAGICAWGSKLEEVSVKHLKLCHCCTDHSPVLGLEPALLVLAITKEAGANAFVHVAVFPTILV